MRMKQILVFSMAFILLIQPAAAVAAESGTASAVQELAGTEPAEGQADANGTGGLTDNPPQDDNPSDKQSEPDSLPGEGEGPQEGTAGQETGEAGAEETGISENEITETEAEITEAGESETEKTETEEGKTAETETEETVSAAEKETAEAGSEESRIVLELPMLEDSGTSPFDFIMDPQGLITETKAAKYGGAGFEEGATLYFKNTDGDYEYSHISDWLSVISRSNVPVCVTVELTVEDAYGISFAQSASFSGRERSMYLALLDSGGNETAVGADGKAVFQMTLPACGAGDETAVCSFALTGCCNPDGDWSGMADCPRIMVNWTAKPLIPEEEAAAEP